MVDLVKAMQTSSKTGKSLLEVIKEQSAAPVVAPVVNTTAPPPVVRSRETDAAKVAAGKPTVQAPVTSAASAAAKTTTTTPLLTLLKTGTRPVITAEDKAIIEKAAEAPKVYTQAGAISWAKHQLAKEAASTTIEPSSGIIGLTTVATPIVTTPVPAAPTETRKIISGEIMGNRNFTVIQVKPVTGDVYYTVEERGKTVRGFENVTDSGSIHWKLGKAVYGEKYGEPSVTTVEPKDVNLVTYFDTTKIPVSTDTLSKYEKYFPTDKDVPLIKQSPARTGTTATPTELGATFVIPGQEPTDAQAAFAKKVEALDPEAPYRAKYYAGVDEKGEPIFIHESPYQIDHDYNPAKQDINQQQLYSQLESDFGSNIDVVTKNIELATEAQKNIPFAEEYLSQLNIAIGDVTKAGKYDDIFLVENGVEVKYKRDEALNKLGSQLEVRQEYLDWKAGKREKMSDDNLTAAEYLDWARTTSEKLPEYQTAQKTVYNQQLLISKYKKYGYKVSLKDDTYSFELPTATEVYKYKHGEWTPAALAAANLMESPLGIKSFGAMVQELSTGDKEADTKVRETRMEELSQFALGLDKSIKEGDYISHVVTSPAMVEGVFLPLVTLGATSLISKGLNVAAPRIVAGLENVGSKFSPQGQAYIAKLTTGAKTVAEPFVSVGKAVVQVGSKLPSTELTRQVSVQALNWGAFGVMEGGKLVEVAVKEPEKFGGVLAESAFTWGVTTSAMGEGLKNLDIKMPEFKSTPAMAEFKEVGSARMEVLVDRFNYKVAAPVKDVLGDVKYAIKTDLKIPEIKAGLSNIRAVARREIYSTIPIQETRADIRAAGAKFTEFGEKVSEKVEVPIVKARKAVAEFKAEIKDTFYEKVPLTRDIKTKVESFKFKEAEPPTTEFVPSAVKTKPTTLETYGLGTKVKPGEIKVTETKPIEFELTQRNLKGTKPFEVKEVKPEVPREVPAAKYSKEEELRLEEKYTKIQEDVNAKMQEWGGEIKGLPPKVEKPKLLQDQLYPTKKPEIFVSEKITVTPKVKEGKLGIETEFKAPENRPLTIEEVNERMRLKQEADIKKGIKAQPTKATKFPDEFTGAGKRPAYLLEVKSGEVKVIRLEDVGKDITGKGKTPLKFSKEDVAKLKGERGTGEETGLLFEEKAKVEVKAKPYEPLVLEEAEETVAKAGFDTSYLYRTIPAKYLVDIEQGIGGTSDYWTGRKPSLLQEQKQGVGTRLRIGTVPITITEQKLGAELDFGSIIKTDTTQEQRRRLGGGLTGTITEVIPIQKGEVDIASKVEQELRQQQELIQETILNIDVAPQIGFEPPAKPPEIFLFKRRKKEEEVEEKLFGKKKAKKKALPERHAKKEIMADIVSVMRSQARYEKATHPKMSKKVYEAAAKTGFRHIPTLEMKTKQYTPRVKSNGLRLDSSKLMVGNLKMKVNKKRGKRNAPRKKRWI